MIMTAYIGANNIAHRVKKMYVGDSTGKARCMHNPIWVSDEVNKKGTKSIYSDKYRHSIGSFNNVIFFAGGYNENDPWYYDDIFYINDNFVKTYISKFNITRSGACNTTIENYIIFSPSPYYNSRIYSNDEGRSAVDAYNKNFVHYTCTELTSGRYRTDMSPGSVGNYALFAGGRDSSPYGTIIDTYNNSLTHSTTNLYYTHYGNSISANNEDYAIFGGSYNNYRTALEAFSTTLVRSVLNSIKKWNSATYSTPSYAYFAGGSYDSGDSSFGTNSITVVTRSLSITTRGTLSQGRAYPAAAASDDAIIIAGGRYYSGQNEIKYATVDVCNKYGTCYTASGTLSYPGTGITGVPLGNKAVFISYDLNSSYYHIEYYIKDDHYK